MGAVNVGPFALPISPLLLLGAMLISLSVAKWVGKSRKVDAEPLLWKAFIAGIAVARISFVAAYFDLYKKVPWTMLDIRDGGFFVPAGIMAAALSVGWYAWRARQERRPLLIAAVVGAVIWAGGAAIASALLVTPVQAPQVELALLGGGSANLGTFAGKPTVLNLWATWCPPCVREMPIMDAAQQARPDVNFVFANQGESPETIRAFLARQGLKIDNILLDSRLQLANQTGSYGLPTTLFFDANGVLIDRRMGEVSTATLQQGIAKLNPSP